MTGVYDPPRLSSLLGTALVSQEAFDAAFPRPKDIYDVRGGRARRRPPAPRRSSRR